MALLVLRLHRSSLCLCLCAFSVYVCVKTPAVSLIKTHVIAYRAYPDIFCHKRWYSQLLGIRKWIYLWGAIFQLTGRHPLISMFSFVKFPLKSFLLGDLPFSYWFISSSLLSWIQILRQMFCKVFSHSMACLSTLLIVSNSKFGGIQFIFLLNRLINTFREAL